MNYRISQNWLFVAALMTVVLSASSANSQEPKKKSNANPFGAADSGAIRVEAGSFGYNTPALSMWGQGDVNGGRMMGWGSVTDSIRKSAEAVRDAKDDDEKKAAEKLLEEGLSKYFDEDMTQRERELDKIEERLTKLRALLERRRAKKQEIIDLQAKVALNEADGLGFYNTERQGKGAAFGAASVQLHPAPSTPVGLPIRARLAAPEETPTPPTPPTPPVPAKR